jgi:regulator of cell morphogenesis and NO signaling
MAEHTELRPNRFTTWSFALLTGYIVENHHNYIRAAAPVIAGHLAAVVHDHGAAHPELRKVQTVFAAVVDDLNQHMWKEENILFPYMRDMVAARHEGRAPMPAPFASVSMPVARMMADHEQADDELAQIRDLTRGYVVPGDACETYRACLGALEEFEHDLHEHVHLENTILFPRAVAFEQED